MNKDRRLRVLCRSKNFIFSNTAFEQSIRETFEKSIDSGRRIMERGYEGQEGGIALLEASGFKAQPGGGWS